MLKIFKNKFNLYHSSFRIQLYYIQNITKKIYKKLFNFYWILLKIKLKDFKYKRQFHFKSLNKSSNLK